MQELVEPLRNELLMPEHLTVRYGTIDPDRPVTRPVQVPGFAS